MSDSNLGSTKQCSDCGEEKPLSDFWKNKRNRDGLCFYRKQCMSARNGKTYRKHQADQGKTARPWRQNVKTSEGMKYCARCEQILPVSEFGKNRANNSGLIDYCRPCHHARGRETKQRLYGGTRHYHLQHRYGITAAEVDAMIAVQAGVCMICRAAKAEHVDHDHKTGEVRGVLCFNRNGGLGQFKDRKDLMVRAIDYLGGGLRPRPYKELLREDWNVAITRYGDGLGIRLAEDYVHA